MGEEGDCDDEVRGWVERDKYSKGEGGGGEMRMTKEEKYVRDQMKCGIKVGDRVRVLRKAKDYEKGWGDSWIPEMDKSVSKTLKVEREDDRYGFQLSNGCYYPFFVLEKITVKKGGKARGKMVTKSRK